MSSNSDTTETFRQFTLVGLGCVTWLAIPAAILGIVLLFRQVFS